MIGRQRSVLYGLLLQSRYLQRRVKVTTVAVFALLGLEMLIDSTAGAAWALVPFSVWLVCFVIWCRQIVRLRRITQRMREWRP